MIYRIEISPKSSEFDIKARSLSRQLKNVLGITPDKISTREVYTISADINGKEAELIGRELVNPVIDNVFTGVSPEYDFDWLAIVGYRPGVTDNVGRTAIFAVKDILGRPLDYETETVFSSIEYMFSGKKITRGIIEQIASDLLANRLIQTVTILSSEEVRKKGIPHNTPFVTSEAKPVVKKIDLNVSDDGLMKISRDGILALTLDEMKAIQAYFRKAKNRKKAGLDDMPTDVELECIAQTWSEHCKHKIFDADIEYTDETGRKTNIRSCFKSFIKRSTEELSKKVPWLVSVFHDNAGVIAFNDRLDLVYKVETHNSPSALDPYGGSMTGIVGVNRDPMGTGQGAKLLSNVWGYCLGSPFTPGDVVPEGLLHPRRLRDGIHKGVIDGGNQSGIPYGIGWEYFDDRFLGKPLVFCGTVGVLPKKIGKVKGYEKSIKPGDLVVMTGGRIGKDGIHGATFSSEELHKDSPIQAVQIGDPITQKMMSDFIYEARDKGLYRFVTDNGAGGLSSSIGEMAKECGGCVMDLKKAPLKYHGLNPWEILVSEAQERMSFAVQPENITEFLALAKSREVEATVLGEFTSSGRIHLKFGKETVASLDIEFLHNGCPKMNLKAIWKKPSWEEPDPETVSKRNIRNDIISMLGRLNLCSDEFKARQYDHEVKGLSVIKPFIGADRDVKNDACVFMAEPLSQEGYVLSSAVLPGYSDIDTYHMMASAIDLALRRTLAAGADFDHIAGLDNFCWPDPVKSEKTPDGEYKLAQLVRANQALYDYTKLYKIPCISGKDSMKNDSTIGGRKISIPPTVLFSTIGKISDIGKALTFDLKKTGDAVYVVGETKAELGGSEYYFMLDCTGNRVPEVNGRKLLPMYRKIHKLVRNETVNSLIAVGPGGIAIALARMSMAGGLGMKINTSEIPADTALTLNELMFSETNGRFIASVPVKKIKDFEKTMSGYIFSRIGEVTADNVLKINNVSISIHDMKKSYKSTLDNV